MKQIPLALIITASVTTDALAQQKIEELVVTANRTESLLSETPIAMTALTADDMRDAGVTDARKLNDVVPNVRLTENGDSMRIAVRGVTSTDTTEKGDPSVAFMLDGVYIARSQDMMGSFFDLQRVEVLRGPQGTLYGRNTTAGVINVLSARPGPDFEASVDTTIGSYGTKILTAMVNTPLNDELSIRAAFNKEQRDNVIKTVGRTDLDPYRDNSTARVSLSGDYDPFEFVLIGEAGRSKGAVMNYLPVSNFYPEGYAATPTVNPRYQVGSHRDQLTLPIEITTPDQRDDDRWSIMGEASYHFEQLSVTYLGSYREADRAADRHYMIAGSISNPAVFNGNFEQQSHELRMAFGEGNAFHGQAGVYYFEEEIDLELNIQAPLSQLVGGPDAVGYAFPQGPVTAESKAAFTQLSYDLSDNLSITGGVRYTTDDKSRNGATVLDFQDPATGNISRSVLNENIASDSWNKTTWKLGIDYDISNLGLAYLTMATGYKAGGFNDGCVAGDGIGCSQPAELLYYEPEELTSIEAGFKWLLLDDTLEVNTAIFTYDYTDLQIEQQVVDPPVRLTRNAAEASINGLEIDGKWLPWENGSLSFAFTWLDAVYGNFVPDAINYPDFNFKDANLDHAPETTFRLGYNHVLPLANGGDIEASIHTMYSSKYYMLDLNNLSQFEQPSYTKTDVTVTYNAPNGSWYMQLFGKNLENEITLAQATSGLFGNVNIEDPRSYGLRAGVKF